MYSSNHSGTASPYECHHPRAFVSLASPMSACVISSDAPYFRHIVSTSSERMDVWPDSIRQILTGDHSNSSAAFFTVMLAASRSCRLGTVEPGASLALVVVVVVVMVSALHCGRYLQVPCNTLLRI